MRCWSWSEGERPRRNNGQRILISLQITFKSVLTGDKILPRHVFQECESGRRPDISVRHHIIVSHRKLSLDLLQVEATALRAP
jgi:hypothetical protein